ncbi:RsmD family RNA methyltransferase [candidate division WWE3 bacterium]|uniref:RsmD family RNA methyltransferase n=1 Tax=candidate division WWE3 bacterium TaxID=2053526 RepID=A0A955LHU0_UNCKA|nr:RsmD family RNA methyltransferase [candidate division WWE3 bacterium]
MNITSGSARGHKINSPETRDLRPTQNQVRLAIYSMLESSYLSGLFYDELRVADLYAGTGALGLEALSRGATYVDFIENNKQHADIIRQNLSKMNLTNHGHLYTEPADTFLKRPLNQQYDLVFLDPPYRLFSEVKLGELFHILKPHGVLIYLHDRHNAPLRSVRLSDSDLTWNLADSREYGATAVSFYISSHIENEPDTE